jgi:Saxitoxin biosynthesis operon protein SxtJ
MITINKHPSRTMLRQFALLWLPLFGAFAGLMIWRRTGRITPAEVVWVVTAVLAAISIASVQAARLVYLGLSYVTFPIGFVISYVALAIVYYLVMTPLALVMRASGRDALRLRDDPAVTSYWMPRPGRGKDAERAFRQF